ncbi:hypothetical protein GCM10010176_103640 [Nonomuraea spiralis]|nr:hypothetical protein GCM10010176_103640 [Nonomuraea spiralis]
MAARVADIVRTRVHNPEAIAEAAKRRVPASSVAGSTAVMCQHIQDGVLQRRSPPEASCTPRRDATSHPPLIKSAPYRGKCMEQVDTRRGATG